MTATPLRATAILKADAGNRALRTFLQGLAYVVLFAVGLVLYNAFSTATRWSDFDWSALLFAAVQAAVMAGFAYLMRSRLDASSVPTPLPPEYPGEPNEEPQIINVDADKLREGTLGATNVKEGTLGGGGQIISNRTGKVHDDHPDRGMRDDGTPIV